MNGGLSAPGQGADDPRLRAARYRDGLDVEELAALAGRTFDDGSLPRPGVGEAPGADSTADAHPAAEDPLLPRRPGSEAAKLAATVDAVARTAVDRAIAEGAFEHLAYAGKPLPDLVASTDPDWWTKSLMRREEVHATEGLGPEALLLRVADAAMEETLDALPSEAAVRAELETFNRRIVEARRQLLGGPPVITPLRDVDAEVLAWRERRARSAAGPSPSGPAEVAPDAAASDAAVSDAAVPGPGARRRRWFRRA
ncbi:MAG: DUF1992 domain-containing protein [Arthrobacter sp.]|jgi:hypothetical protein|nr:DUF1992 domain-containing protein [Arthrobacter sp.]